VDSTGPAAAGTPCVFPFTFGGETFSTCTPWVYGGEHQGKPWCSTKVDSSGVHVNGEGNYGFCGSQCETPKVVSLEEILGSANNNNNQVVGRVAGAVVFGGAQRTQTRRGPH
jgi:hypothetical protein